MPIYHRDRRTSTVNPTPLMLTERLRGIDGLILITPEHNGGTERPAQNTIDWITRVDRAVFKPMVIGLAEHGQPSVARRSDGLTAMRAHRRPHAPGDPRRCCRSRMPERRSAWSATCVLLTARDEDRSNAVAFVIDFVSVLTDDPLAD